MTMTAYDLERIDKLEAEIEKAIENSDANYAVKGIVLNRTLTNHILRSNNMSLAVANMTLTLFKEIAMHEIKQKGWK